MKLWKILFVLVFLSGCLPYKEKSNRSYRYSSDAEPMKFPDLSDDNPDVRGIKEVRELPRRIRKSKVICPASYTSDTTGRKGAVLIVKAAYNKKARAFYLLSVSQPDVQGTQLYSCTVYEVSGRYLLSSEFHNIENCGTWQELSAQLKIGNMALFGGRTLTEKEMKQWSRRNKIRKFFGLEGK